MRFRTNAGGMKADDAERLKELENENQNLKATVADQALQVRALKEISRGRMKVPTPRTSLTHAHLDTSRVGLPHS